MTYGEYLHDVLAEAGFPDGMIAAAKSAMRAYALKNGAVTMFGEQVVPLPKSGTTDVVLKTVLVAEIDGRKSVVGSCDECPFNYDSCRCRHPRGPKEDLHVAGGEVPDRGDGCPLKRLVKVYALRETVPEDEYRERRE